VVGVTATSATPRADHRPSATEIKGAANRRIPTKSTVIRLVEKIIQFFGASQDKRSSCGIIGGLKANSAHD
jgi:hypothetical protein